MKVFDAAIPVVEFVGSTIIAATGLLSARF